MDMPDVCMYICVMCAQNGVGREKVPQKIF